MSIDRKLIVHIGSHKSGTTSIQKALVNNPQLLAEQGFTLFQMEPEGGFNTTGNGRRWVKFDRHSLVHSRIVSGLADALNKSGDNVVLSAETLSWLFDRETIQGFRDAIQQNFSQVRIIAYLRRQDRQLVSHYQQSSKNIRAPAWLFYGGQPRAMPAHQEHFRYYLDYNQRLGIWGDMFGDDNLTIRVFQKDRLHQQDVVSDFFFTLGFPPPDELPRENVSRSFEQTKLGHLMNQVGLSKAARVYFKPHLDMSGKLLPTREEARTFYDIYRASNCQLNARFSVSEKPEIFDDDFAYYPEQRTETWTEKTANRAIVNILKSASTIGLPTKQEVDFLIGQAIAAESTDPETAMELMRIAQKFRPDGPLIKEKLAMYRKIVRGERS